MTTPDIIRTLVDRFGTNIDQLRSASYNETQIRREYIDPFFVALGWDVDNHQGFALPYREVIHEDSIVVAGGTKAPDYSFRIGGMRKFFVEAKKPSVNLKDDVSPAFQLRRYAWSAKLPLSILSDFEEFAVYDCRNRPSRTDKASNSRISYFTFTDFVDKWEEIHSVFSKDAVLHGSFDKYAEAKKGKKGTADVDDAFLAEIESWRSLLARNIALRNPRLSQAEINFAVQRTVDRIIFLRICEDRGIETYGRLQEIATSERTYKRLVDLFRQADDKYNSGLFHFASEKDRSESLDTFTLDLKIDDKVMKDIIGGLYYPESPYEFSVLPADILGSVYERFLGKVIRLTKGHQAKIEEKPEVRKAGGVYYTPTYIVDYIVKNTVGKLAEGKTPKEVSALRVLDPACGSGSFLIGAYQDLLDWHRDWYAAHEPEKFATTKNPPVYFAPGGEWKLTTTERKRILLNNVYGVDIDTQAVEVTKLSLLLKVLEGENEQTINAQLKMFHERALPDLGNNIKCGNSLIGSDFFDGKLIVDSEERMRINAFDWKTEFKEIMDRGGFDAVIGNPPYVRSQLLSDDAKFHFAKCYEAASYQPDTFAFFLEKGITLLNAGGRLGYILPNGILTNTYYATLRGFVLQKTCVDSIVDLKSGVFENAAVDTSVFILERSGSEGIPQSHRLHIGENDSSNLFCVKTPSNTVLQSEIQGNPGHLFNTRVNDASLRIARLLEAGGTPLGDVVQIRAGMKVRKEFVSDRKGSANHKQFLIGRDISPYKRRWSGLWVNYDKRLESEYSNQAFRDEDIFLTPEKLLVRQVMGPDRIFVAYDDAQFYVDQTLYLLLPKRESVPLLLLMAILSSRLLGYYFGHTFSDAKETFPKIKGAQLEKMPICRFEFDDPERSRAVNSTISQSLSLVRLHCELEERTTDHERTALQRQIDTTDKQIDALVYELYGLTEEEIRIVESQ